MSSCVLLWLRIDQPFLSTNTVLKHSIFRQIVFDADSILSLIWKCPHLFKSTDSASCADLNSAALHLLWPSELGLCATHHTRVSSLRSDDRNSVPSWPERYITNYKQYFGARWLSTYSTTKQTSHCNVCCSLFANRFSIIEVLQNSCSK